MSNPFQAVSELLAAEDDGRACRDIPEEACREQPRNAAAHVSALAASKSADGLVDPKLVLSWLLMALGAPAAFIGLLVPVREAGALLPQLFTASVIRRLPQRKWVWVAGALAQGACAAAMALVAVTMDGALAAGAIAGLLLILAIARSACSVSYRDVLGKTIAKARRGRVTGLATTWAAGFVVVFALILVFDVFTRFEVVISALLLAAALWVAAALIFAALAEAPGATEGGANALAVARDNLSYLALDRQLRIFIGARGLLTATALAPPFMLAAVQTDNVGYAGFGFLLLASAAAGVASSYVWGRLSDRSSRRVLILAAFLAAVVLAVTAILAFLEFLDAGFVLPTLLFGLMIAYQGVRLGRSTHVVDMTTEDKRAAYTALANTIVGALLIVSALFGLAAQVFGAAVVLALLALLSMAGGALALQLEEVQSEASEGA